MTIHFWISQYIPQHFINQQLNFLEFLSEKMKKIRLAEKHKKMNLNHTIKITISV